MTSYGNNGRTGEYAAPGLTDRPRIAWRVRTDGPVMVAPVVDDAGERLIVAARRDLHVVDARTGAPLWTERGSFLTTPAIWRDRLIAENAFDARVIVYDLGTGEHVRMLDGGGCPTVVGDLLLLDDLRDDARALRLPDFETVWTCKNLGSLAVSPALGPDGRAYAAEGFEPHHTHGGVRGFDLSTGETIFAVADRVDHCPLPDDRADDEDWVYPGPFHIAFAHGLVWTVAGRDHDGWGSTDVYGLDPVTGEPRWVLHLGLDPDDGPGATAAVAVADRTLYLTVMGRDETVLVQAIDVESRRPRWATPLAGEPVGSPVIAGDCLYLATRTGVVHAVDRTTGLELWRVDVEAPVPAWDDDLRDYHEDGMAILPVGDTLYVRTESGVVALRNA